MSSAILGKAAPLEVSEVARASNDEPPELTILMPCLNEAETLETCIRKARAFLQVSGVRGEIVVSDNGSTDNSREIAQHCGARVVQVAMRGYGAALHAGSQVAAGKYIIMGDADDSYDFTALMPFVDQLRQGHDLVMGNRFAGGIKDGAMPWKNRYIGNPILTNIGRLFFRCPLGDFHCGLRGYSAEAFQRLDMQTAGMEFASEMVIKATLLGMKIAEVPCTLHPDGRSRPPHLRPWRDGWRHLRFMLIYSPRWLFLMPGMLLCLLGLAGFGVAMPRLVIGGVGFDVSTLLFSSMFILMGYQSILFAVLSRTFAVREKLLPPTSALTQFHRFFNLERGLLFGLGALTACIVLLGIALNEWRLANFGAMDYVPMVRLVIPGVTLGALGFQTVLTSFFISMMGFKRR